MRELFIVFLQEYCVTDREMYIRREWVCKSLLTDLCVQLIVTQICCKPFDPVWNRDLIVACSTPLQHWFSWKILLLLFKSVDEYSMKLLSELLSRSNNDTKKIFKFSAFKFRFHDPFVPSFIDNRLIRASSISRRKTPKRRRHPYFIFRHPWPINNEKRKKTSLFINLPAWYKLPFSVAKGGGKRALCKYLQESGPR